MWMCDILDMYADVCEFLSRNLEMSPIWENYVNYKDVNEIGWTNVIILSNDRIESRKTPPALP